MLLVNNMDKNYFLAASDLGVHIDGAKMGAKRFKQVKKSAILLEAEEIVKSTDNDLKKNLDGVNKFNEELYKEILKSKSFNVVIGGDHSISIASILASKIKHPNLGIIWIDAHTDFNTFFTTITGNIHGMPLATVVGYHNKELVKFFKGEFIDPKKVVVIGARSIDELELVILKKMNIKVFTMEDIKKLGIKKVLDMAIKIAGLDIHVSFDLDVIDPIYAPGVSIAEEMGISVEDALFINNYLVNTKRMVSYDLVEYNMLRDKEDKTWNIALKILDIIKKY